MPHPENVFNTALSEFRSPALFDQAKDRALDYMNEIHGETSQENPRPVYPNQSALDGLSAFDEPLPKDPGSSREILDLLHTFGSPATVAQTGGRYFGFVNGSAFPAALAAKWLADVWDQNAGLHVISPVAARLEQICEGWLKDLFGLPESTVAGFVSGTSTATFCGLAAGRNRVLANMGWDIRAKGLFNALRPRVIIGEQAHSTVFKALSLLGFGLDDLERVPCDSQGRMRADCLPDIDATCLVILQAGNVNTGAFDPLDEICSHIRSKAKAAWIHIDGAFGLWAAASPELAHLTCGMEKADAWSVDAHKTLNTPYDCGIVLCRHPDHLVSALQNSGDYIIYGDQRDPMLYTPEMSRRARGIELWATMKFLGKSGMAALVERLCHRAKLMGKLLKKEGFILHNEVVFNQVLVALPAEADTQAVLRQVQEEGTCWCGGSVWKEQAAIRISVCGWTTTDADIRRAAHVFAAAKASVETRE